MEFEDEKRIRDEEDLEKVLKVVSTEVPKLIENIMKPLKDMLNEFYSPESVKMRADAFVTFYRTLVDNGVPEEEALKLAKSQILDVSMIIEKILGSLSKKDITIERE